jgi:succinate dehydrogenase flavin-adding protein (antitoxin of CptAB toxin-antitoxin module)
MEGGFGGFPFGGDPEDLLKGLREFAEQQAESVQEAQREQFATLTLNTAVELTAAALSQLQPQGSADEQAMPAVEALAAEVEEGYKGPLA